MAKARKLPRRIFKDKELVHARQQQRETEMSVKHMTRDHMDVLQNIEFALVSCWRRDPRIDDRTVDQAIQVAMQRFGSGEGPGPQIQMICNQLQILRDRCEDVSDEIWRAGLSTVSDSIHRHSSLSPGEKAYLNFVSQYVR